MTFRKRKKNSRQRGSHTHGWGEKKKHRKAGHRGGKGRAGSGKRADQKKPMYWLEGRTSKSGFKSKNQAESNAINVGDLSLMIDNKKFEKKGNSFDIDLSALGYTKLLSKGAAKYPMNIAVLAATEKAVEKVKSKGGNVVLPQ
ncbi:uL15 family ribosomal protein [Candidatus Woesearchaeota archaeon]|nr:uL15 family ribosomal protein [Candidatus Woesearchaeota archaeon]